MDIPEWKWERITMDFVVGLPRTSRKFDAIWVIVDRLTMFAHFILVGTTYYSERLAKIDICEIVRLHGMPCPSFQIGVHSLYHRFREPCSES